MRLQRLLLSISTVVSVTLWTWACGDGTTEPPGPDPLLPTAVTVSPATATVVEGDTLRLTATATNAYGQVVSGAEFVWASGDTGVAVVDTSGLATGIGAGQAEVTATTAGVTGSADLTIAAPVPTTVAITPDTVVLSALGHTAQLTAEVRDQAGRPMEGIPVAWSSADTTVAVVDSSGLVTAVRNGAVTVTATAGEAVGDALVTVAIDLVRAALVALYNATDGPNWIDNTNWLTDAPLGEWYGVEADGAGRVVRLDLRGKYEWETNETVPHGLSGPIPPELGNLSNLRWLRLDRNELTGAIPPELGTLSNLESLSLCWNQLSGPIPPELGRLAHLEHLCLLGGAHSGPIPPELGDLVNLEHLSLGAGLTGPIPAELSELANLRSLSIAGNNLSGPIPPWLGDLVNLEVLSLTTNRFTGPIPPELGNLPRLTWLNLWRNSLTGPVPPELGNLVNLRHLGIGGNQLTGAIPRTFLNLQSLESLDWSCGIRGICVPGTSDFDAWVKGMEETNWGSGPFCNAADQAVLTTLFDVTGGPQWTESDGWLDGPALEDWAGVDTDSLGRVTSLVLSENGLSGRFPASVANLLQLRHLRIDGNGLGGRLPLSLTARDLDTLHYHGTEMCAPPDDGFQEWLDDIESHMGTGTECAPSTDRNLLAALYELTGGSGWLEDGNWLTDAPLGLWHGVEVNAAGRIIGLDLAGNRLTGRIPLELGGLDNLERLDLSLNDLSGPIPPELRNLSNLRWLILYYNHLSGPIPQELGGLDNLKRLDLSLNDLSAPIPPELGGLTNLYWLNLYHNHLSGSIPPELGALENLNYLYLSHNHLSGSIPPQLGNLENLFWLQLHENDFSGPVPPELGALENLHSLDLHSNNFTGPIPPELGSLENLHSLDLHSNNFTGPIPPEVGSLANLVRLHLAANDLSGPIPPTFGGLPRLTELELSHNPGLTGAIPAELTDLELQSLMASGTELCMPRGSSFEEWLATIPRRRIALCGEPPAAYLVQAVQSRTHPVPLVAGEDALLRVFVTAATETTAGIPEVRARFYLNGTERHVVEIAGTSTAIPTEIDEGDLAKSANAEIPGRIVRPGLEMVVEIDPSGTLDPALGVPERIPEEGRLAVKVREMPLLDLTVIPFLWSPDPDSAIIGLVDGMAADPEGHALLEDTHVLLPVADIDVTPRAPVASTSNNGFDLLAQTEAIRVLEGGGGHYMGMMSGALTGPAGGIAYVSGRSNFSRPNSGTVAHELGHNMSLWHAPCGGASGPDPSFPYPDGTIGAWGYDFRRSRLVPALRRDHMSYCGPTWTSDYHFTNALSHRLADEGASAAAHTAAPAPSLLLWGGVDTTGTPFLNPVFVADAPPTLPDSAGDYTVTGRDADGRELFSLSFAMPVALAEEAEVSSFVFALPARPGWEDTLASVTLSGPAGTATLDGDSDIPMTILRDPVTGQVRAILRSWEEEAMATVGERGMGVLFSRGIPQ